MLWKVVLTLALFAAAALPLHVRAGTTGTIQGTIRNADGGAPVANATVTATSPTGSAKSTSDAKGFYVLQELAPDTYSVSVQASGFQPESLTGITVQQDLVSKQDLVLHAALKTIVSTRSIGSGTMFKPYTGTDVYNVSGAQLNAATGGDNLHKTVNQYLVTVPGVTPIGGAYNGEPSIRGGYDVDDGYELDGIPVTERVTGYFTTNLTDLGLANVEVYTGGLAASNAGNGTGVINSVIKTGTYPGFANFSAGITGPDFNHYMRAEYGAATPDKRFSWYLGFDAANSTSNYWAGNFNPGFPITVIGISSTNPLSVSTRDLIGNFHYHPDAKNDLQFFYQNSLWDSQQNLNGAQYPAFALRGCPGAVADTNSPSNASGGIAPDGQTCPAGLYVSHLPDGAGNFVGHYSGIGKIQWNHIINDKSSIAFRLAENFNQYIFDQPYSDPNNPENTPLSTSVTIAAGPNKGQSVTATCPNYPYVNNAPLPVAVAIDPSTPSNVAAQECTHDLGDYWQSRKAQQYYLSADYTATPNANTTIQAGVGQEFDNSTRDVRYLNLFNPISQYCYGNTFSYPCIASYTDIPTHVPYVYAEGTFNDGRFTFEPGLRYSRIYYGVPQSAGGGESVGFWAPSLLGTYRLDPRNAFRFSYAVSGQFVGTEFMYRLNSTRYDPATNGAKGIQPQVNHMIDFQWERQLDATTTLKVGPYYRAADNYLAIFTPFLNFLPGTQIPKYGPEELESGLQIRALGAELGLTHTDNRPTGFSYWLAGSYDNYWTQTSAISGGQVSFINTPLPGSILQQGIFVRGYLTPILAGTLTSDAHANGWHLISQFYYALNTFYNTGGCIPTDGNGHRTPYNEYSQPADCFGITDSKPVLAPQGVGGGYWNVNATLLKQLNEHYAIGLQVLNLTNNQRQTTPCFNSQDSSLATGLGSGCSGQNGPHSGTIAPIGYIYQNLTQNPINYELFFNAKL